MNTGPSAFSTLVVSGVVNATETLCDAARKWANVEIEKKPKKKRGVHIPSSSTILTEVKDLPIPPLTFDVPISKDGNYDDVPNLKSYRPTYDIANGLSRPKIMVCVDTLGREYRELVREV